MPEFAFGVVLGLIVGTFLVLRVAALVPSAARAIGRALGFAPPQPAFPSEVLRDVRQADPALANIIESPPKVDPADVPAAVEAEVLAGPGGDAVLRGIENKDVRELLGALRGWKPKRREKEYRYGNDLRRWVETKALGDALEQWPQGVQIELADDASRVQPDFCFRNRVLVEIKADIWEATTADRALGQMLRYLLAWKETGPAILVICGECRPLYEALIRIEVETWREKLQLAVTVFFVRYDDTARVPSQFHSRA
jgi:hypothetical protein